MGRKYGIPIRKYEAVREFDGNAYKFVDRVFYKLEAERLKRQIKSKGHLVRIVKLKHGYEIWAR